LGIACAWALENARASRMINVKMPILFFISYETVQSYLSGLSRVN
jgi:hypothetical protein